jgi:hypothetical protein
MYFLSLCLSLLSLPLPELLPLLLPLLLCSCLFTGAQASFNVTVRPKLYGIYESTRAKIKYGSGVMEVEIEGVEPDFRSGYSTSLGRIKIISSAEHERSISYHLRALSLFGIIYAVPTFIPFLLWLATKSASARISRAKTN